MTAEKIQPLGLRSIRDLSFRLGIARETLEDVAACAGRYYRPFPKRTGAKVRWIDNPVGPLRTLQDCIQARLLRPLRLPDYLHGGIPRRSPRTNAIAHLGQQVVVRADIGDCFPSITHQHVFRVWRETLGCTPTIARLLTQLTTFERHLPQGAPTSTTLANLVLHAAGAHVRQVCAVLGLTYTTFIDDLTFSGEEAPGVLNTASLAFRKAGFRLPHHKIKILRAGAQKQITGVILGPNPTVPKEMKSKVRAALHRLSSVSPGSETWGTALRSTHGLISHISSIDLKTGKQLRAILEGIKRPRTRNSEAAFRG